MTAFTYTLPTVGGNADTWGNTLNQNWQNLSTFLGSLDSAEVAALSGVTSAIQAQIDAIQAQTDAKAADTDASIANSINLTGATSDWVFTVSGDNLVIKYGSTSLAKLDTSGNLTVSGDVTAFGTP